MVIEGAGTTLHPSLPGQILEVGAEQWSMWAAEIWAQWQPVMGTSLSSKGRALYLTSVCRNRDTVQIVPTENYHNWSKIQGLLYTNRGKAPSYYRTGPQTGPGCKANLTPSPLSEATRTP